MKQKIPTIVGTIIIVIIAVTAGMYVYQYEKGKGWLQYNAEISFLDGDDYYQKLSKKCGNDECCQKSLEKMRTNGFREMQNGVCPEGEWPEQSPCSGSLSWCVPKVNENLVGNDKDEHGCIGSAGYTWCEEKQKCVRPWEESCGADNNQPEFKINPGWKLVSGDLNDTCSRPTFQGEAEVRGWYVWETSYVSKEWLFRIVPEDLDKLPLSWTTENGGSVFAERPFFKLADADPALVKKLKNASQKNPVKITIRWFYIYCEGAPIISQQPLKR